jgi:hypothetical protein
VHHFDLAAQVLGGPYEIGYTPRRVLGKAVGATGFARRCGTCESNDRLLNHVIEATPVVLILPNDHPGQRRDEAEVGKNIWILPLRSSKSAAGIGRDNDSDLKEYLRCSGGHWI